VRLTYKYIQGAVMALMDESVWRGKIYSGGWVGGDLGTGLDAAVIEPPRPPPPGPDSAGR